MLELVVKTLDKEARVLVWVMAQAVHDEPHMDGKQCEGGVENPGIQAKSCRGTHASCSLQVLCE